MGRSPENLDLSPDLARLPSYVLDLIRNGNRGESLSRTEARVAFCTAMFQAGYSVAEIWMVMTDPGNGISETLFEEDGERAEAHLKVVSEVYEATTLGEW